MAVSKVTLSPFQEAVKTDRGVIPLAFSPAAGGSLMSWASLLGDVEGCATLLVAASEVVLAWLLLAAELSAETAAWLLLLLAGKELLWAPCFLAAASTKVSALAVSGDIIIKPKVAAAKLVNNNLPRWWQLDLKFIVKP